MSVSFLSSASAAARTAAALGSLPDAPAPTPSLTVGLLPRLPPDDPPATAGGTDLTLGEASADEGAEPTTRSPTPSVGEALAAVAEALAATDGTDEALDPPAGTGELDSTTGSLPLAPAGETPAIPVLAFPPPSNEVIE